MPVNMLLMTSCSQDRLNQLVYVFVHSLVCLLSDGRICHYYRTPQRANLKVKKISFSLWFFRGLSVEASDFVVSGLW